MGRADAGWQRPAGILLAALLSSAATGRVSAQAAQDGAGSSTIIDLGAGVGQLRQSAIARTTGAAFLFRIGHRLSPALQWGVETRLVAASESHLETLMVSVATGVGRRLHMSIRGGTGFLFHPGDCDHPAIPGPPPGFDDCGLTFSTGLQGTLGASWRLGQRVRLGPAVTFLQGYGRVRNFSLWQGEVVLRIFSRKPVHVE